jgi:GH24 family phage-related lysozyme (muramidase)
VLIAWVLFRLIKRRKKDQPIPEITEGYIPLPMRNMGPNLSFDEIFQWINREERGNRGPALRAFPDGRDKKGNQLYSIGYGHQIQPNESDLLIGTITENKALELFEKDIRNIRNELNRVVKVPLNKNQQLAILSLRYNIGGEAFKDSTLLRKLNQSDFTGAALEFKNWRLSEGKVVNGLVLRRERERVLFSKPVGLPIPSESTPTQTPTQTAPNVPGGNNPLDLPQTNKD